MSNQQFIDDSGATRISGTLVTFASSEPADADVPALSCIMWYGITDATDGALNFKGRSSDGTILTGSVAMSD